MKKVIVLSAILAMLGLASTAKANPCKKRSTGYKALALLADEFKTVNKEFQNSCDTKFNLKKLFVIDWKGDYCEQKSAFAGVPRGVVRQVASEFSEVCEKKGPSFFKKHVLARLKKVIVRPGMSKKIDYQNGVAVVETDRTSYASGLDHQIEALASPDNPCAATDAGWKGVRNYNRKMNGKSSPVAKFKKHCGLDYDVMSMFEIDLEGDYCQQSSAAVGVATSVITDTIDEFVDVCKKHDASVLQTKVFTQLRRVVIVPGSERKFSIKKGVATVNTSKNSVASGLSSHIEDWAE